MRQALNVALVGAAAVWVMDRFDWFAFNHVDERARRRTEASRPNGMDPAHALAAKAAHAIGTNLGSAPAHQHPAGLLVHYAVPMGLAVLYDVLKQRLPAVGKGGGMLYGAAVFIILDEIINPALGLAASPKRYPWQRHVREMTAHMIYAFTVNKLLNLLSRHQSPLGEIKHDRKAADVQDAADPLADFATFSFEHGGRKRTVYRKGKGPAVMIMHEVPGVSAEVIRFARKVVDAGFTVFMPHMFGVVGVPTTEFDRMKELAKLCISREFHVLAERRSSPIVDWLRALGRHAMDELGGPGVGAVGMCVTGNFALTMTLDPWIVAPVMAHPSFPLPITPAKAAAVHATPETLTNARRRIREDGLKVLGLRFSSDILFCRAARFETLRRELGEGFEAIELPGSTAAPHAEPPHSVLTIGLRDHQGEPTKAAVDRVIVFLSERLKYR